MKNKIVFFGASKFVIPIIEKLNKNFDLALVVSTEKKETDAVPLYCKLNNIHFLSVINFNDEIKDKLKKINAIVAALAYFGMILPKNVLDVFPNGIINIHPSLIPHYRGATPVQSAILNGDKETGVTIIRLDEKMDHGPILSQEKENILDTDTTETLHERLFKKGADMLINVLPKYLEGGLKPQSQNDNEATFTKLSFSRHDGYFDCENPPSKEELNRMVRAYYPWPGAWTIVKIKNKELRIKLLPNNIIQAEGKKPMSYKDFINGYPELRGIINKFIEQ